MQIKATEERGKQLAESNAVIKNMTMNNNEKDSSLFL